MRRGTAWATLAFAGALLASPARAERWHTVEVTDGDSITFPASGFAVRIRGRISGLDTPEIAGRCAEEQALAQQARSRLIELVRGGVRLVSELEFDRYGRILITQVINRQGQDVAQVLIREGLARKYDGRSARQPWCPEPKAGRAPR